MSTAIEIFNKESTIAYSPKAKNVMGFDPTRFYSGGHCAEFAYSLASFASELGLSPQIVVMFFDDKCPDTSALKKRTLSHCIVQVDDETYDISGMDARGSWFLKNDYMNQYRNTEHCEWHFVFIPFDRAGAAFDTLRTFCARHDVSFSPDQIERDGLIFKSISENPAVSGSHANSLRGLVLDGLDEALDVELEPPLNKFRGF